MRPIVMPPNRLDHFYLGGSRITDLRGVPATSERSPEEWLASTVTRFGEERTGLSTLPDGRLLRDALEADPDAWLGAEHQEAFARSTGLLVKLLDAGQRLPVHLHPDRAFSRRHLDCEYGKTESWYVLEADPGAVCYLGFQEEPSPGQLADWVETQNTEAMLSAMHQVEVRSGDGVLVPAGLPHATGEGIFVVEAQEPTDLSILLDWAGLPIDGQVEGHLELGFPTALQMVDRTAWSAGELEERLVRRAGEPNLADALQAVLPAGADPFFRVHLARPATAVEVGPGFAVVIVLDGAGDLATDDGEVSVSRGDVLAVPFAAGSWQVPAGVTAIVCRPGTDGPGRAA
ncbi:MAG: class I mannose-6-phosphate isomerase [Nitriliruptoraceae bacterium]